MTFASIPRALLLILALSPIAAVLADEAQDARPVTRMKTLVVSGEQPGPGLWKVSKGEHVLWILGTLAPLPKRMEWTSRDVEATIAASQEVLMPSTVEMKIDGNMFGGLFLLPKLLKARNNPDGQPLSAVVPEDLYARWLVLKQQYLGRDRGVEKRRPLVAAQKLHDEALDDEDLSNKNIAAEVARRAAKKHDVPMTTPSVTITIKDPKKTVSDFAASTLDDVDCFGKTLRRLESEIETLKLRANAWALGEVAILRSLTTADTFKACAGAVLESRIAKQNGFSDLQAQVDQAWHDAADVALKKNLSTFALVPMAPLLADGGHLDRLRERGYTVLAPGEEVASDDGGHDASTESSPLP